MKRWLSDAELYASAGHTHVPIPIKEIRQMATRVKGTVKDGKFKPKDTAPVSAKIARKAKADRTEKGLRKNRSAKA